MFRKESLVFVALAMLLSSCAHSASSYVEKGKKFFAEGRYQDAELQYRNAINKDPRYAEAYYQMGLLEMREAHLQTAYEWLKHSVELNPAFRQASIQLGDLGWYVNRQQKSTVPEIYNDLLRISQRLLAANPQDFDGLRFKAYIAISDKRVDDALRLLQTANAIHPLDTEVIMPMVQILVNKGQIGDGESLLRQLITRLPAYAPGYDDLFDLYMREKRVQDAEALLRLHVEKSPKETFALVRLADFYSGQQNTAAMNATLQRLRDGRATLPGARMGLGDFYFAHKSYDQAFQTYELAAREDSKNEVAYRKKIEALLVAQGKNDEAQTEIEKILKRNPQDSDALLLKAAFDMKSGQKAKVSDAANIYKDLSTERPNDSNLRFYYARALLAKGDSQSARAELTAAIRNRPNSPAPKLALADLALKEGKDPEALRLAEEVLEQTPSNPRARLVRATVEQGMGQTQGARADLSQVLREQPENQDAQLQLALLDVGDKHYQEAAAIFSKYYHPGQKDLRALEGLVRCETQQGQFDKALALMGDEVKKSPRSAPLRLMFASVAMQDRKADVAQAQFEALVAQNQDSSRAELEWAELKEVNGDPVGAIEHYRKAFTLDPKNSTAAGLLGRMLERTGHQPEAIESYRAAIKADSSNIIALNNLAYSLAQNGQNLDEALRMALSAQKLSGDNPDIADTVGWVYLKKGLTGSALLVFQNNVRKYPKSPSFHYHLGAALLANGENVKAKEELQKALENNPSRAEEPGIRQLLAKIG
jgi:tetratricopeptide (TPR) repeat protein